MKHLVGKKMSTEVAFMGETVKITKLSVAEILKIQEATKKQKAGDEVSTLRMLIKMAVEGAKDLSDQEIESFPLDELSKLGGEIVKFSGMNVGEVQAEVQGN
jgi:hypothetical protein